MKNGFEVDAPMTEEIGKAASWVIRGLAFTLIMYGIAKLLSAAVPLIEVLTK
jgi:hypothetical protein